MYKTTLLTLTLALSTAPVFAMEQHLFKGRSVKNFKGKKTQDEGMLQAERSKQYVLTIAAILGMIAVTSYSETKPEPVVVPEPVEPNLCQKITAGTWFENLIDCGTASEQHKQSAQEFLDLPGWF